MHYIFCRLCGKEKKVRDSYEAKKAKFCSVSCSTKHHLSIKGKEGHPSWKGGKRVNHNGYIEIRMPEHPRARKNGYVFEHIVVAEEKIGRPISSSENVHHIDENKTNNRPENLEVLSRSDHTKRHPKKRSGKYIKCIICETLFYRKPSHVLKAKCCSRSCSAKYQYAIKKGEIKVDK